MAGGSGAEHDANAKFGREPGEHQWFDGGSQMLGGGFRHVSNMFFPWGGGLPATSISTRPTQDVDPLAPKKMRG